jgi:hypothetical protein
LYEVVVMPKFEVPDWLVKLVLGSAAVGGAIYILYKLFAEPADYWRSQYEFWVREYVRELKEFLESSGGTLTQAQREVLEEKRARIGEVERKIMEVTGQPWDKVVAPLATSIGIAAILALFPYEKVARAIKYFKDNSGHAKSSHGTVVLLSNTVNACFYEVGNVSLATASQITVNNYVNNYLYPTMSTEAAYLQAQLPYLAGVQYAIASYLISAIQYQMSVGIPAMMAAISQTIPIVI